MESKSLPQLGIAPLPEVVAALTLEEKVKLLIGMGLYPEGFDVSFLLPAPPDENNTPERVPGAAGRTHAVERLGIPLLVLSDGPAGVRISPTRKDTNQTFYATQFPSETLLASSWDTEMVESLGKAFGDEVKAFGVNVLLAPGMNIHRNPLGGRNFEYYSEDPVVTGEMAAAFVKGVESNGVGTSIKHFAVNNQEFNRMNLDTAVNERPLREIYLKGFEIAVKKAQPWTIMTSYNLVNGTYTSESPDLLTKILRDEWGYTGLVMTDWYGGKNPVAQIQAGNDLLMPGTLEQYDRLIAAYNSGELKPSELDACVTRVLELVLKSPTFHGEPITNAPALKANAQVSRKAATEGMVLLRNESQTLPLKAGAKVALFGNASYDLVVGGTGSGDVHRAYTVQINEGLAAAGFEVVDSLAKHYTVHLDAEKAKLPEKRDILELAPVLPEAAISISLLAEVADGADYAIFTLGRSSGEGGDRKVEDEFELTNVERELISQIESAFHAKGKKVVVLLNVGGPVEVASWRDQADAILLTYLPGQEGGNAVVDVLSGKVNPSGKLATTFPAKYLDIPFAEEFPGKVKPGLSPEMRGFEGPPSENSYQEGLYVGYRYFTSFGVSAAYDFGFGLSYTTFQYNSFEVSLRDNEIEISLRVTNAGEVAGREVVQFYVSAPTEKVEHPARELKAFSKTSLLEPGSKCEVMVKIPIDDLAYFDDQTSAWAIEEGEYTIAAASSATDEGLTAKVRLPGKLVLQSRSLMAPAVPIEELQR